ncbi:MAG: hypothetical protein JXA71_18540 [Chitinispirillaceae bacterium]|nr:hypothetical protein [Chitinispirillaceae bacterium]
MPFRLSRLFPGLLIPLCLVAAPLDAGAALHDPQIPHGERVVHTSYVNDTKSSQEELVETFDDAGEKIYRYTATKSDRTIVAEIVAKTMTARTVTVTTRDSNATVRQSISLVAKHRDPQRQRLRGVSALA